MADQTQVEPRLSRSVRLSGMREQEILRATYDLLAEVGYEGLRLDMGRGPGEGEQGYALPALAGKGAKLVADAVRVCQTTNLECPDTGSLRGDLVAMMEVMAASMKSDVGPFVAGLVMAMLNDPEFAAEMRGLQSAKRDIAAEIHARAVGRGELSADVDANLIEEIAPAQLFMQCFRSRRTAG